LCQSVGADANNQTVLAAPLPVPVHNVVHHELGHSDLHLGASYAMKYWLPFLWSIDPGEFDKLLSLCSRATTYETGEDDAKLVVVERVLHTARWRWAGGRTLPDLLREQLVYRYIRSKWYGPIEFRLDDHVNMAIRVFWRVVARAALADGVKSPVLARGLFPPTAVVRAANAAAR
jgi:hypothetical protein